MLSNSTTHDTRVILGSVDLDEASFDAHRNQFEEVLVFDNDVRLYQNLADHFKKDLRPVLKPFFTSNLVKAAQKQVEEGKKDQDSGKKSVKGPVILDNETTDKIAETDMVDLLKHDLQHDIDHNLVPEMITKSMRDITMDRSQAKEKIAKQVKQHDTIYTLQKEAVSPRAAKPKLKTREKLPSRFRML